MQRLRIGFLRPRQKRARSGRSTTLMGFRTTRFRSCFSLSMLEVAPKAACHALDRGLSPSSPPGCSPGCLDGRLDSETPLPSGSWLGAAGREKQSANIFFFKIHQKINGSFYKSIPLYQRSPKW
ncbi:hypothetical protein TNIN_53091 [Trichonephila inaurata madagascariensis]|uniref:Uncharacterized protein n=1 Tax=Trichonephila inaurata madagascariensis TaxID=2747483 RepID=A0A8X7CCK7_9ARAC|nr:hypothetical protein TNIN_53091 [Trichonephila inaurata madagascariensis]